MIVPRPTVQCLLRIRETQPDPVAHPKSAPSSHSNSPLTLRLSLRHLGLERSLVLPRGRRNGANRGLHDLVDSPSTAFDSGRVELPAATGPLLVLLDLLAGALDALVALLLGRGRDCLDAVEGLVERFDEPLKLGAAAGITREEDGPEVVEELDGGVLRHGESRHGCIGKTGAGGSYCCKGRRRGGQIVCLELLLLDCAEYLARCCIPTLAGPKAGGPLLLTARRFPIIILFTVAVGVYTDCRV